MNKVDLSKSSHSSRPRGCWRQEPYAVPTLWNLVKFLTLGNGDWLFKWKKVHAGRYWEGFMLLSAFLVLVSYFFTLASSCQDLNLLIPRKQGRAWRFWQLKLWEIPGSIFLLGQGSYNLQWILRHHGSFRSPLVYFSLSDLSVCN